MYTFMYSISLNKGTHTAINKNLSLFERQTKTSDGHAEAAGTLGRFCAAHKL